VYAIFNLTVGTLLSKRRNIQFRNGNLLNSFFFCIGEFVAIKILEDITGNEEEIEDEYLALRDLSLHPNIPSFHGIYFVKGSKQLNDQLWFVMEVRLILSTYKLGFSYVYTLFPVSLPTFFCAHRVWLKHCDSQSRTGPDP